MKKQGFTLIEILIVVVIIGILTSIVLVGVGGFRERARDTKRVADIRSVQGALEIYYAQNNAYPVTATGYESLKDVLVPSIIPTLPSDPLGGGYKYEYISGGVQQQNYILKATLETAGNKVLGDDMDGGAGVNYGLSIECGTQGIGETEYCVGM